MKAYVFWLVAVGSAGSLLCPGCAAYHDPASGAKAWYGCETLRAKLDLEIGAVYVAAKQATADLYLKVRRSAADGISGEIRALDARYDTVEIRLKALPRNRTAVAIRIEPFGDKQKSIVVFVQIMENLSREQQLAAASSVQWGTGPLSPLPR
jgi:hypothetical protein